MQKGYSQIKILVTYWDFLMSQFQAFCFHCKKFLWSLWRPLKRVTINNIFSWFLWSVKKKKKRKETSEKYCNHTILHAFSLLRCLNKKLTTYNVQFIKQNETILHIKLLWSPNLSGSLSNCQKTVPYSNEQFLTLWFRISSKALHWYQTL
jgi:hypothetical protein